MASDAILNEQATATSNMQFGHPIFRTSNVSKNVSLGEIPFPTAINRINSPSTEMNEHIAS